MRGAIIGFGTIAMGHVAGYAQVPELSVGAVVDPSPERRRVAARSHGLRGYATLDEMMAAESPDFIDVCAPPDTHNAYIEAGVACGLHVLCEKPVFLPGPDGYDRLLATVRRSRGVVYPCHNYKFAPILALMERVVRSADFGEVLGARFRTLRRGHAVGVPEWRPHWRRDPRISGGGIIRDHGPHSVYLARHLTERDPVAVSCLSGNLRDDAHRGTEDTALITVRCAGDVQFSLDLTWAAGHRNSYYAITGSAGSVVVENDDVTCTLGGRTTRSVLPSDFDDPSHKDWFRQMFLDFLATVADRGRQPALLEEALVTALVVDAAYRSAANDGAWVDVPTPHLGGSVTTRQRPAGTSPLQQ